jgi:hypothetical protein
MCFTSCPSNNAAGDLDCASADWCNGSTCVAKLGGGASCSRNRQCASGTCKGNGSCV